MSDPDLDELFGDLGGEPTPKRGLIVGLIAGGLSLAILGLACTSVPGSGLVLLAWYHVERDQERLDNGYLPASCEPQIKRLQLATWIAVGLTLALFVVQGMLLQAGVYDALWGEAIRALAQALGAGQGSA